MEKITSVEEYIDKNKKWKKELEFLRQLMIDTSFEETMKWSIPCYTINNKNVLGIACFKKYVGIWFYQGVFLSDPKSVLINAQEGKTKAMRQWRFQNIEELKKYQGLITMYIKESIQNQLDGLEVKPNREKKELLIPALLAKKLTGKTKIAFEKFSGYKKREFCAYISEAKREQTKLRRLEKILPMILSGIGLGDKYRK